jgi:hypothetical protein
MKTLPEILAEVQALATVTEDQFETSLASVVSDLQAVIAAPAADPIATAVVTTVGGVVTTLVPQTA